MDPEKLSTVYYHTLGIRPNATLAEIKKAYRQKAKLWHPDLNHNPGARERFIEINEAYEYLIRHKIQPVSRSDHRQRQPSDDPMQEWIRRERQKARERAAREAKKRFEEFKKSPLYKTSSFLYSFYDYLTFAVGIFMILAAWTGMVININPAEGITAAAVISALVVTVIGVIFILFSFSNIKSKKKLYH